MAFFQRRRGTQVTVYYWDRKQNKTVRLPRKETRHLDGWSDLEIQKWVDQWEDEGGRKRARSRRRSLFSTDALAKWFELHLEDHKALNNPRQSTVDEYRYHLTYIEEYFVRHLSLKDFKKWAPHTPNFGTYLRTEKGLLTPTVRKLCHSLARFGRFLVTQGQLSQPWLVRPPRANGKRQTPLIKTLTPEECIGHANTLIQQKHPLWAVEVLLSYFGSLRPEEVYALSKADFLAGMAARQQAKTWSRFQKYGLGSGLSVQINKTLTGKKVEELTKTHYAAGVVNIWYPEAAKMLGGMLQSMDGGPLFVDRTEKTTTLWTRNQVNYRYGLYVKPVQGLNAGDRRRASANYLAKQVGVDPVLLQDHLRHSELETTMLYTRDPAGRVVNAGEQDFNDVG